MRILEEKIFLSTQEAEMILGVSKSHVYNLIKEKRLAATKERPLRIPTRSMKEYIRKISPCCP